MRRTRAEAHAALLAIPADRLQRPIEWHTAEHTVGFRLHRFAQHDLELTTDVRATLAAAGFRPTRTMQIAAALVESWGEVESALLGVPTPTLDAAPPDGEPSPRALLAAIEEVDQALAARVRAGGEGS